MAASSIVTLMLLPALMLHVELVTAWDLLKRMPALEAMSATAGEEQDVARTQSPRRAFGSQPGFAFDHGVKQALRGTALEAPWLADLAVAEDRAPNFDAGENIAECV